LAGEKDHEVSSVSKLDAYQTAIGDDSTRKGRLQKANEFYDAAELLRDWSAAETGAFSFGSLFSNAFVALCVLSGIASSDAICIRQLGRYARGQSHDEAASVLEIATDRSVAKHLRTLLNVKTKAEYNWHAVGDSDIHNASEAAKALLTEAQQ
jgi:hypothetical protein